jgi:hypothetical protein
MNARGLVVRTIMAARNNVADCDEARILVQATRNPGKTESTEYARATSSKIKTT